MKAQIYANHTGAWIVVIEMGDGRVYCMTYPSLERALEWMGNTLNDGGVYVEVRK